VVTCCFRLLFVLFIAAATNSPVLSKDVNAMPEFDRCKLIVNNEERLRCFKQLLIQQAPSPGPSRLDAWKLIRTPDSQGGQDTISIMSVADISRSSPDLAGLLIRCRHATATDTPEPETVDILIVLVRPLSPRARPKVKITAAGAEITFNATAIPSGSAILLPHEAQSLAAGDWRGSTELAVDIQDIELTARGIVPIDGLVSAFANLRATCNAPRR
jgi:hypothetical protein